MARWIRRGVFFSLVIGALGWSVALGQYRPPPAREEVSPRAEEEEFERAVDLRRFRKGNFEWDTQELIASGLTALHREHQQILKKLQELEKEIERLKQR